VQEDGSEPSGYFGEGMLAGNERMDFLLFSMDQCSYLCGRDTLWDDDE
jgi:hypothetical protein